MSRENKARFGLTMSPDLLHSIDEKRDLVPRARYIEYCLREYFRLVSFKEEELKFYDELLSLLPEIKFQEGVPTRAAPERDIEKIIANLGNARIKIIERKQRLLSR